MTYINTANDKEIKDYMNACDEDGIYHPENDPSLMTLQQKGIAALTEAGYEAGEYNPHNVRAWVVGNEFGALGVVVGAHEQEALDEAVDSGFMDSELMSQQDYKEYSDNGWHDSYTYAGNASEAIWTEHLSIIEINTEA
tara:strand:- start:222 stop:638 length:417 start_codon:yes stop_codon:yes gene_type:complete